MKKLTPSPLTSRTNSDGNNEDSNVSALFLRVADIVESARKRVTHAVNHETVTTYWLIGREIVQTVQGGEARAQYGSAVIANLATSLTARYGSGFSDANLKRFRLFYLTYPTKNEPIIQTEAIDTLMASQLASDLGTEEIRSPLGAQLASQPIIEQSPDFHPNLSWSHYRALMRVADPAARRFYETEAVQANWSRRDLERQIGSLFYERLLASPDQTALLESARQEKPTLTALDMLKDPYVLEFLDLPQTPQLHENQLEQAIIDKLQHFLLELGRGFSFVSRQKRMRFDDKDFYVDLVFYNYLLKCFVLIDLKIGPLTHQDIGQMDGYVRMFEAHDKVEGDNPTIGLILCSEKNTAVARYSVLHESVQLFAAKYQFTLPSEEDLQREILRERALIENQLES
jgi:predicted nuclease of restriction endonuclease-like (RecB) superfamily